MILQGYGTDPTVEIDVEKGITPIRREWIEKRGDTEEYEGRVVSPRDNGYAKEEDLNRAVAGSTGLYRTPRRAKSGKNVNLQGFHLLAKEQREINLTPPRRELGRFGEAQFREGGNSKENP